MYIPYHNALDALNQLLVLPSMGRYAGRRDRMDPACQMDLGDACFWGGEKWGRGVTWKPSFWERGRGFPSLSGVPMSLPGRGAKPHGIPPLGPSCHPSSEVRDSLPPIPISTFKVEEGAKERKTKGTPDNAA